MNCPPGYTDMGEYCSSIIPKNKNASNSSAPSRPQGLKVNPDRSFKYDYKPWSTNRSSESITRLDKECKFIQFVLNYVQTAFNDGLSVGPINIPPLWKSLVATKIKFPISGNSTPLDPLNLTGVTGIVGAGNNGSCDHWSCVTSSYCQRCEYGAIRYILGTIYGISDAKFSADEASSRVENNQLIISLNIASAIITAKNFKCGANFDTGLTRFDECTATWQDHYTDLWPTPITAPDITSPNLTGKVVIKLPFYPDPSSKIGGSIADFTNAKLTFENLTISPDIDFNFLDLLSIINEIASVIGYDIDVNHSINSELNDLFNWIAGLIPNDILSSLGQLSIPVPLCL